MATGRNSATKEECKEGLLSYFSADHDETEIAQLAKMSPDEVAGYAEFEIFEHSEPIPEDIFDDEAR